MAMAKHTNNAAANFETAADQTTIQQIDRASAVPKPEGVEDSWHELEYAELQTEQAHAHDAAGLENAHDGIVRAAGLTSSADAAKEVVRIHGPVLQAAADQFVATVKLSPYRRRSRKAKRYYTAAKCAFLLGDLAGISSAALWLGEPWELAVLLAASAATATVVAGLPGSELRLLRDTARRQKQTDELQVHERPFAHLFAGRDRGMGIVRLALGTGLAVGALIACSIGTLRGFVDDPVVGVIFGTLAFAVALASGITSYMQTDDIADLIDHAEHAFDNAQRRHKQLAGDSSIEQHHEAIAEAASLVELHTKQGNAALARVRSLMFRVMRNNPGVFGHGEASQQVGRLNRRDGAR